MQIVHNHSCKLQMTRQTLPPVSGASDKSKAQEQRMSPNQPVRPVNTASRVGGVKCVVGIVVLVKGMHLGCPSLPASDDRRK